MRHQRSFPPLRPRRARAATCRPARRAGAAARLTGVRRSRRICAAAHQKNHEECRLHELHANARGSPRLYPSEILYVSLSALVADRQSLASRAHPGQPREDPQQRGPRPAIWNWLVPCGSTTTARSFRGARSCCRAASDRTATNTSADTGTAACATAASRRAPSTRDARGASHSCATRSAARSTILSDHLNHSRFARCARLSGVDRFRAQTVAADRRGPRHGEWCCRGLPERCDALKKLDAVDGNRAARRIC